MKKSISLIKNNTVNFILIIISILVFTFLYLYKLGSLVPAFGPSEHKIVYGIYGITGFFNHIFYLPIEIIRSILFSVFTNHGYFISRLPNVLFGLATISMFAYIVYQWHGKRTAFLSSLMLGASAWMLHVSRISSFDIMFGFAVISLIFIDTILKKYKTKQTIFYLSCLWISAIVTIPGMIWLVFLNLVLFKDEFSIGWQHLEKFSKKLFAIFLLITAPILLAISIFMHGGILKLLGLPNEFTGILLTLKNFIAAPVHLFVRGPQYPEIWLDQAPMLDVFVLLTFLLGIYFYITHKQASRSKILLSMLVATLVLVGFGGQVSLTAPFVMVFLISATGITFLLKEWLSMFPINPIARFIGISLVVIAVSFSCIYGIRSYFIAWPKNSITKQTFIYKK